MYITAWVSALLIWLQGFLRTSTADKQQRNPRFLFAGRNYSFPRLDKDLAKAIYVETGFL